MPPTARPRPWSRLVTWWASPAHQTDALQMLKSAVAATVAWALAEMVLGLEQAFLAPWMALLTVHATVYRTVWRGAQTVVAVAAGILVSFVVVELFAATVWSFGLAILVGLVLGRVKAVRDEGITVATTILFVITSGYGVPDQQAIDLLPDRLLATAVGVVVAVLVNLVVFPPLNDRSAQHQIDDVDQRLGRLLSDMAEQMRRSTESQEEDDWIERTRSISGDVEHAWSLVRGAQEAGQWNPRRRNHPDDEVHDYPRVLVRLEEGVAQARSIARHVRRSHHDAQEWDPRFRDRFIELLDETGRRVADPDASVAELRSDLSRLADDLSDEDLSGRYWPLYGALIANLMAIVDVVDDVATARPVRT
ncbi:aromatic acid exporter family protein [Isoptericola sp. S6320L]|uniref:FUSC family protein n=1 Tax=Isoptericola sp. S6320L TaxID=2926411 RepID=UPI001FF0FEBC|nr:aromatic acid exporter family protein [Isoptericola sp. S6320L]MCK0117536.1 aromatic acid exporter family protein [Isoptericola sp. S6320L]